MNHKNRLSKLFFFSLLSTVTNAMYIEDFSHTKKNFITDQIKNDEELRLLDTFSKVNLNKNWIVHSVELLLSFISSGFQYKKYKAYIENREKKNPEEGILFFSQDEYNKVQTKPHNITLPIITAADNSSIFSFLIEKEKKVTTIFKFFDREEKANISSIGLHVLSHVVSNGVYPEVLSHLATVKGIQQTSIEEITKIIAEEFIKTLEIIIENEIMGALLGKNLISIYISNIKKFHQDTENTKKLSPFSFFLESINKASDMFLGNKEQIKQMSVDLLRATINSLITYNGFIFYSFSLLHLIPSININEGQSQISKCSEPYKKFAQLIQKYIEDDEKNLTNKDLFSLVNNILYNQGKKIINTLNKNTEQENDSFLHFLKSTIHNSSTVLEPTIWMPLISGNQDDPKNFLGVISRPLLKYIIDAFSKTDYELSHTNLTHLFQYDKKITLNPTEQLIVKIISSIGVVEKIGLDTFQTQINESKRSTLMILDELKIILSSIFEDEQEKIHILIEENKEYNRNLKKQCSEIKFTFEKNEDLLPLYGIDSFSLKVKHDEDSMKISYGESKKSTSTYDKTPSEEEIKKIFKIS